MTKLGVKLIKYPPTQMDPLGYNKGLLDVMGAEGDPETVAGLEVAHALFFVGLLDGVPYVEAVPKDDLVSVLRTAAFQNASTAVAKDEPKHI